MPREGIGTLGIYWAIIAVRWRQRIYQKGVLHVQSLLCVLASFSSSFIVNLPCSFAFFTQSELRSQQLTVHMLYFALLAVWKPKWRSLPVCTFVEYPPGIPVVQNVVQGAGFQVRGAGWGGGGWRVRLFTPFPFLNRRITLYWLCNANNLCHHWHSQSLKIKQNNAQNGKSNLTQC